MNQALRLTFEIPLKVSFRFDRYQPNSLQQLSTRFFAPIRVIRISDPTLFVETACSRYRLRFCTISCVAIKRLPCAFDTLHTSNHRSRT